MVLASLSHQTKSPVSLECFSHSQAHINYVDTIVRVLASLVHHKLLDYDDWTMSVGTSSEESRG